MSFTKSEKMSCLKFAAFYSDNEKYTNFDIIFVA